MIQHDQKSLNSMFEITTFARHHAFNHAAELTPTEFIADEFLRRPVHLALDRVQGLPSFQP